jgi:hypothetical protein
MPPEPIEPIKKPEPPPTLRQFEERFMAWVKDNLSNIRTQAYYQTNYTRLLEYAPLANAGLDTIGEPLVEAYKAFALGRYRKDKRQGGKITINHYLKCLRKALRYAWRLKLFDRPTTISLYGDEKSRDFVFGDTDYQNWLAASPEPL